MDTVQNKCLITIKLSGLARHKNQFKTVPGNTLTECSLILRAYKKSQQLEYAVILYVSTFKIKIDDFNTKKSICCKKSHPNPTVNVLLGPKQTCLQEGL